MNKDRLMLLILFFEILLLSFVNNTVFLALYLFLIILLFLVKGGEVNGLILTIKRVIAFSFVLSIAFYLHSLFTGENPYRYILLFNLRLFDMVFSVLFFRDFANPVRAFSFSKTLSYMFTLTYSQIQLFLKVHSEFNMVMRSRMVKSGSYKERLLFFAKMTEYFFKKALRRAENTAMAMKSRGFFLYD